jgi:hypothetical protein
MWRAHLLPSRVISCPGVVIWSAQMRGPALRRLIATVLAFVFITSGLGGFFQANVQEWAKANEQDQYLVRYGSKTLSIFLDAVASRPFMLVAAFLVGGAVFLWGEYFLRKRVEVSIPASAGAAPPPPESKRAASLGAPQKFYSRRNKDDLADALTDLKTILNTTADDIVQMTWRITVDWDKAFRSDIPILETMVDLRERLHELSTLTVTLNRAFYNDNGGLLSKNNVYADELDSILKLPKNSSQTPLTIFQTGINRFRDAISVIEKSCQYNDPQFTEQVKMAVWPILFDFQGGDLAFRTWLDETRKRTGEFQSALDKAGQ